MIKIGRYFQIAALILLAAGAQPAYSALWMWSRTAALNGNADPTINFQEGMSPSSVNDSARALMARVAEWRDDVAGNLTTGGSASAYTLTTFQAIGGNPIPTPPPPGQMLAFVAHAVNSPAPTLAVDGGTAYPIQPAAGVSLPAGALQFAGVYRVSFNASSSVWVLEGNYATPYGVPLGALLASTLPTPPNANFILPAGQCISTTTYAAYWAALGAPASGGCAGGQFAVIDLRGRVLPALDNLGGSSAGRLTGSSAGCGTAMTVMGASCANGLESETLTSAQIPAGLTVSGVAGSITGTTDSTRPIVWDTGGISSSNAGGGLLGQFTDVGAVHRNASISITGSFTGATGTAGGGGAAHPTTDPNIAVYYFLRVI